MPYDSSLPLLTPVLPDLWKADNAAEAAKLFKHPLMKGAAMAMAAAHPHALDYIKAAPILVPATGIHRRRTRTTRDKPLGEWAHLVGRGPKLRLLMSAYNLHYQSRALDGRILTGARVWPAQLMATLRADPSALAQAIPKARTNQAIWLSACIAFYRRMVDRGHLGNDGLGNPAARAVWATIAFGRKPPSIREACDIADYLLSGPGLAAFRDNWSIEDAARHVDAWHVMLQIGRQLTLASDEIIMDTLVYGRAVSFVTLAGNTTSGQPIRPGRQISDDDGAARIEADYSPWPNEPWVGKTDQIVHVVPLRSPKELWMEGHAMNHCVADYATDVEAGASRIYSIRSLLLAKDMTTVDLTEQSFLDAAENIRHQLPLAEGGRLVTFEIKRAKTKDGNDRWYCSQFQGRRPFGASYKVPPIAVPWAWGVISAFMKGVVGYAAKASRDGRGPGRALEIIDEAGPVDWAGLVAPRWDGFGNLVLDPPGHRARREAERARTIAPLIRDAGD